MAEQQQQRAEFADGQPATPVTKPVAAAAGAGPAVDLSAEIASSIERDPGDRVRCTWVSGNNYRCNWWAPGNTSGYDNPGMFGLTVTTHQVRKSQFLSVTKVGDRLVIRNRSHARTRREITAD